MIQIDANRVGEYMVRWTEEDTIFLRTNYPTHGLAYCANHLGKRHSQIRDKASRMGLKINMDSDFFKDWQSRAALSKVGKKRPEQAKVLMRLHSEGKLKKTIEQCKASSDFMKEYHRTHPHPRGALGMIHTDKTKEIMSERGKERWANMSEEERDAYSKRMSMIGIKSSQTNRIGASWKAGWRVIGENRKFYRSRWEANYAMYLQWLKENGKILKWEHEPETFWFDGIKRGCMSYLPDFRVTEVDGSICYHEVKGWMDDRSKTKIRRMAKYHPNVKLIVIDAKPYKALERQMSSVIVGWEK